MIGRLVIHELEKCGSNRSSPTVRRSFRILCKLVKKTTKIRPDTKSPGRGLSPGPPEYEAEAQQRYGDVQLLFIAINK
jgi:hypothetical protein